MSTEQLGFRPHANQYLFADYYLDNVVRQRPEWQRADVAAALARVAEVWAGYEPEGDNEAQLEHGWVQPVLEALGHSYRVQVPLKTPRGTKRPDYVLGRDAAAIEALKGLDRTLTESDLGHCLAIADAKAWDRSLDQRLTRAQKQRAVGEDISSNPTVQIDYYIRYSGLSWGILTNGRLWRLYHQDSSKRYEVFYEVDLPALIERATAPHASQRDLDDFKFFWLFFRREAFEPDGWLATVLDESETYERGVSEHLKRQVYDALRELAQGFLAYPPNGLEPTPETLKQVHDASLIALYRLLFTLYAEDRGLLPVRENPAYAQAFSLHAMKRELANQIDLAKPSIASSDVLWHRLRSLWQVIDKGNDELGVHAYNGGLFNAAEHPFLERYACGDLHLRRAIDLITRAEDPHTGKRAFVDYRDLEIRHLGSIYEGLLEYRLRYADTPLTVRKVKGKEVYEPLPPDADATADVPAGQAYLATDKGERKATGSYYTPDYIVQYIVENAVGPVLDEVGEKHADDPAALERAILACNFLDPAMGSGHFLVAIVEFVAQRLVDLGLDSAPTDSPESEIAYWKRRVAQACIYGVDLNPLAVELAKLSLWLATIAKDKPLSFLDHHLRCGNSLIGARVADLGLGPSRTEKSKRTRAKKAEEAAKEAGQLSMLDSSAFTGQMIAAVDSMAQLEAIHGETLDEVHEAERIWIDTVRGLTEKWRTVADIETARHFGLEIDPTMQEALRKHLMGSQGFEVPQFADIVEAANQIAEERRFFHWELEFPEVFFDEQGRVGEESGFEAVVGNPPYMRIQTLITNTPIEASYYDIAYSSATGKYDIYVLFLEQSYDLLSMSGLAGFICPNKFMKTGYGAGIREHLSSRSAILAMSDFGDFQVFAGISTYTMILLLGKMKADRLTYRRVATTDGALEVLDSTRYRSDALSESPWRMSSNAIELVFNRIKQNSDPLSSLAAEIFQGIITGQDDEFVLHDISDDQHHSGQSALTRRDTGERVIIEAGIVHPYLKGSGIREYHIDQPRLAILYPYVEKGTVTRIASEQLLEQDFPLTMQYLHSIRSRLESRGSVTMEYEAWYALWCPRQVWKFESPKVLFPAIADRGRFAVDRDGRWFFGGGAGGGYGIILRPDVWETLEFVTSILNSAISDFWIDLTSTDFRGGYHSYTRQYVERIPIRRIAFTTPATTRTALVADARALYATFVAPQSTPTDRATPPDPTPLLDFTTAQLSADPERSDVVHDLLAFLAEQMIALHEERQKLEKALDPFKFLDRDVEFVKLPDVLADEIKYGELVREPVDLGRVHHDIDGLRLVAEGDRWALQVETKLRDPEQDWGAWQYEEDGRNIQRRWVTAYRFEMDEGKARYYRHALPVRGEFEAAGGFPGGKTRTTLKKLHATTIPSFDDEVDLGPLEELGAELAEVRRRIEITDDLIDQIVYRLYGLTEDEIAIVEGASTET